MYKDCHSDRHAVWTCLVGCIPISFLDKYCPEQFEILGCSYDYGRPEEWDKDIRMSPIIEGRNIYKRLFIRRVLNFDKDTLVHI